MIPFNKPYLTGKETHYLYQAALSGKISGDGIFTKKCHSFFEERYGFQRSVLTTSCTDALEMAAILVNIEPGDEVIAPSYTFVSTVNAFVLRGAKIVFVDCLPDHPNMDVSQIEVLITTRTKVIIPVHYAGIACNMALIMELAAKYGLFVVEDAAQAIDSRFNSEPLGSIGHLAAFSFHETKNIVSGEGGMLAVNEAGMIRRAEIIREKGTNRSQFFRGEVDKYSWVDIGSSFLPSDIIAAFLFAQLEHLEDIQAKRKAIWHLYEEKLRGLAKYGVQLPYLPEYATNNAHMFYLVCNSLNERTSLIQLLKDNGILSVFHYLPLHKSPFYAEKHDGRVLPETDRYADCLFRLPLFYELEADHVLKIADLILRFYHNRFSA
jgi:dTDP-4-amino-4,6-dideoxygalactose transaminase